MVIHWVGGGVGKARWSSKEMVIILAQTPPKVFINLWIYGPSLHNVSLQSRAANVRCAVDISLLWQEGGCYTVRRRLWAFPVGVRGRGLIFGRDTGDHRRAREIMRAWVIWGGWCWSRPWNICLCLRPRGRVIRGRGWPPLGRHIQGSVIHVVIHVQGVEVGVVGGYGWVCGWGWCRGVHDVDLAVLFVTRASWAGSHMGRGLMRAVNQQAFSSSLFSLGSTREFFAPSISFFHIPWLPHFRWRPLPFSHNNRHVAEISHVLLFYKMFFWSSNCCLCSLSVLVLSVLYCYCSSWMFCLLYLFLFSVLQNVLLCSFKSCFGLVSVFYVSVLFCSFNCSTVLQIVLPLYKLFCCSSDCSLLLEIVLLFLKLFYWSSNSSSLCLKMFYCSSNCSTVLQILHCSSSISSTVLQIVLHWSRVLWINNLVLSINCSC